METLEKTPTQVNWRELAAALTEAVAAETARIADEGQMVPDLTVEPKPELRGVLVSGCCIEVFIMPKGTGVQIESWRPWRNDPYKIVTVSTIADAVHQTLSEL